MTTPQDDHATTEADGAHRLAIRVYYEDTDMAGIVYYANYLRFLERGRTEAVRALGIDQRDLRDRHGIVLVVRRLTIDYLAPARFDDMLTVVTGPGRIGGARLTLPQSVWRGGHELVRATVDLAAMTGTARVARLPADIRRRLQPLAAR